MTEEELTANALSEPDNLPLTKLETRKFKHTCIIVRNYAKSCRIVQLMSEVQ